MWIFNLFGDLRKRLRDSEAWLESERRSTQELIVAMSEIQVSLIDSQMEVDRLNSCVSERDKIIGDKNDDLGQIETALAQCESAKREAENLAETYYGCIVTAERESSSAIAISNKHRARIAELNAAIVNLTKELDKSHSIESSLMDRLRQLEEAFAINHAKLIALVDEMECPEAIEPPKYEGLTELCENSYETPLGRDSSWAQQSAKRLAKRNGYPIHWTHNGTRVIVNPDGTIDDVLNQAVKPKQVPIYEDGDEWHKAYEASGRIFDGNARNPL